MIVVLWYHWIVDHTNRQKESQKIQLYYQAHKTVLSNETISIGEEGWGVWFCAFKKQISSKTSAFQICHQWNWCWPCKVLLFCATSCEVVIYDSFWCLLVSSNSSTVHSIASSSWHSLHSFYLADYCCWKWGNFKHITG